MVLLARNLSNTLKKVLTLPEALLCAIRTAAPELADSAKPRVWIKTAILCSTPSGCLAAGRKRKTFAWFWHTDKGGSEQSWFSRSARARGRRAWRGKVTRLVFESGLNSPNTGQHGASVTGKCGCCSVTAWSTKGLYSFLGLFSSNVCPVNCQLSWVDPCGSRSKIPGVCPTKRPIVVSFVWKYHLGGSE